MEYNKPIGEMVLKDIVEGFYVLKDALIKVTAQGKPYLSGTISDRTGYVEIKVWDYYGPVSGADVGKVVKIRGELSEYRGFSQLTVSRIRLAAEGDQYDISQLVPVAPIDVEARMAEVQELIASIEDEDYRQVAEVLLERHMDAFRNIPAAKSVHHGFLSGLLMHTSNMMKIADFLSSFYKNIIDRSLLLTGTLLHDLAKEREFTFSELGIVTSYSVKGQLLGHPVMGAQEVAALAGELDIPEEKSLLLQHLLLSHHGNPEFGAAVKPLCAEAELLYCIDTVDSRMEIYEEALADVPAGEFSSRIYALEKKIYHHG